MRIFVQYSVVLALQSCIALYMVHEYAQVVTPLYQYVLEALR